MSGDRRVFHDEFVRELRASISPESFARLDTEALRPFCRACRAELLRRPNPHVTVYECIGCRRVWIGEPAESEVAWGAPPRPTPPSAAAVTEPKRQKREPAHA